MEDLIIRRLETNEKMPWELLLMADPSKEAIEKYLPISEVFIALLDNELIGAYVLANISPDVIELKNIAVYGKYQGKGFGKKLVLDAISKAKDKGVKRMEVGTGNSSLHQLALYQKCGFGIVGIEKDFFVKNYKEEIIENGIRCVDMIRLAITFK
jgi:ribosomal protein S18 acetylase RimI-like enzyme